MFNKNNQLSDTDLEFMSSLSSAVLQKSANSSKIVLWITLAVFVWFIAWASFAQIDEITKGDGKVIPSSHLQVVQNLEGGIVNQILVKEGDSVKKGDVIIRLDDVKHSSEFEENKIKLDELTAKIFRLRAEAEGLDIEVCCADANITGNFINREKSLFRANKEQLINKIKILNEQLNQKISEQNEATSKINLLQKSYSLISKEVKIAENMANQAIGSGVDLLKIQREANNIYRELEGVKLSLPKIDYAIQEIKSKMLQEKLDFQNKAKEELNKTYAEIDRTQAVITPLKDQVQRTMVTSPVDGTVKQLFVNTIGGVITPGMNMVEIVPSEDNLLVEAKIRPADIAFLYPGQKSILKFTAYDFSIYGGLDGEVIHISADTIIDKTEESYYLVKIKAKGKMRNKDGTELAIIPGMTVSVDIITGKKTIMDYLLKPILKAQNSALTER